MPRAKTSKKPTLSKSDFIRAQPATLSAAEVVAKGRAAGVTILPGLVYEVRRTAKVKKATAKKTSTVKPGAPAPMKPPKSKAGFVRGLPASTPAKEVVKQARALGIKLGIYYVYNVRRATKIAAKKKRAAARTGASVPRPITTTSAAANLLKAVAAEIGLGPAIEILSGERARVRALTGTDLLGRRGGPDEDDDEFGPFRIESSK